MLEWSLLFPVAAGTSTRELRRVDGARSRPTNTVCSPPLAGRYPRRRSWWRSRPARGVFEGWSRFSGLQIEARSPPGFLTLSRPIMTYYNLRLYGPPANFSRGWLTLCKGARIHLYKKLSRLEQMFAFGIFEIGAVCNWSPFPTFLVERHWVVQYAWAGPDAGGVGFSLSPSWSVKGVVRRGPGRPLTRFGVKGGGAGQWRPRRGSQAGLCAPWKTWSRVEPLGSEPSRDGGCLPRLLGASVNGRYRRESTRRGSSRSWTSQGSSSRRVRGARGSG